jgi:acyl carrier protein
MGGISMVENVITQLKFIITDQLDVNITQDEIDVDTDLFEDGLGLDSIAIVEFITLIEDDFNFEFEEDELNMEAFENLRTLAHFISERLEEKQL